MNYSIHFLSISLLFLILGGEGNSCFADSRIPHTSQNLCVSSAGATPVVFNTNADIQQYSIPAAPLNWGMDVAWDSEDNVIRGTNYIGKDVLNIGRVSFQPSDLIGEDGQLSAAQKQMLQTRLDHIALSGVTKIVLNCDHEVLCNEDAYPNSAQNYTNYYGKPQEWLKVIKASVKYCQSKGFEVITISPFNEPDYTAWKEGTQSHFKSIAKLISEDPDLQGIRICAGNTLNCDQALSWYKAVKPYVTEGNTHQLAGSFDNYAKFWEEVRADGNHATADELHNVGEAFIGAHYGMQSGIWWGWDGIARGEYCRASVSGKEIGYAENRSAWSAACVYKRADGRMDAFLGTSERQATPSEYEFVSSEVPAFYNGAGPVYSYSVAMPGGTGYQQGQTNAEQMVQIHAGADVPLDPIQAGKYGIMNVNANLLMGYLSGATTSGTEIALRRSASVAATCQWELDPIPSNARGDRGYYFLRWGNNRKHVIDVKNWSTAAGTSVMGYEGGLGTNEQWFFEYAGKNSWYIRSRHSGLYLEVKNASTALNAVVIQSAFTGKDNQKWRLMPIADGPKLEVVAPAIPTGLAATTRSASIHLSWTANTESDMCGYAVYRNGNMIGRMIRGTEFLDNDVRPGVEYSYQISAIDKSRNQSALSTEVTAALPTNQRDLILHYTFEQDTLDQTDNQLDPAFLGTPVYDTKIYKEGVGSLRLNSDSRCLQLPAAVGYYRQMTLSAWIYLNTTSAWQRIFDFGNDENQYFFLTPTNGSQMRLVMKNKGDEQILSTKSMGLGWHHVAVTLSDDEVVLYVDNESIASTSMTIRPADFAPKRNYVGRSQFASDPFLSAYIDDFRIYNYPLTEEEVAKVRAGEHLSSLEAIEEKQEALSSPIYSLDGRRSPAQLKQNAVYLQKNKKMIIKR